MRLERTIICLMVLLVVLFILLMTGIGYAAETGDLLKINETSLYVQSQKEFEIEFADKPIYEGTGKATVKLTGETNAIMNITELKEMGDYATVIFTIQNKSNKISADINATISNSNKEYFQVTSMLSDTTINPKMDKTTLKITVKLIKLPIEKEQKADIGINIFANPRYE